MQKAQNTRVMSVHIPVCISVCLAVSLSTCPHRMTQLSLDRHKILYQGLPLYSVH